VGALVGVALSVEYAIGGIGLWLGPAAQPPGVGSTVGRNCATRDKCPEAVMGHQSIENMLNHVMNVS